jgi:hypothetical protein
MTRIERIIDTSRRTNRFASLREVICNLRVCMRVMIMRSFFGDVHPLQLPKGIEFRVPKIRSRFRSRIRIVGILSRQGTWKVSGFRNN